jgi:hypothetical protein
MTVRDQNRRSFWAILWWWERRRLSYNLFLATIAIPAFLLLIVLVLLLPSGDGDLGDPLLAVFAIPVFANICYTAGWLVEGVLLLRAPKDPDGPTLMRAGLAFSAVVALVPSLAVIIRAILHV